VDDHDDTRPHDVTMGVGSDGFAFINDLAPAPIRYHKDFTDTVTVNGGVGDSTYTVTDTIGDHFDRAAGLATTTTNTGLDGSDTVNVQRTTGSLKIDGQFRASNVNVNVGLNDSVRSINGDLLVVRAGSLDVHNRADTVFRGVILNGDESALVGAQIRGLAPEQARIIYRAIVSMEIQGGIGGNHFTVFGTVPNMNTKLELIGNNEVDVFGSTNNPNTGNLQIQLRDGNNEITVHPDALDQ